MGVRQCPGKSRYMRLQEGSGSVFHRLLSEESCEAVVGRKVPCFPAAGGQQACPSSPPFFHVHDPVPYVVYARGDFLAVVMRGGRLAG